jgi:hypothetical protein
MKLHGRQFVIAPAPVEPEGTCVHSAQSAEFAHLCAVEFRGFAADGDLLLGCELVLNRAHGPVESIPLTINPLMHSHD